jgi:hypothetical protein
VTNSDNDSQRPPTFPSVGGTPSNPSVPPNQAPFTPAHDEPVVQAPVASTPVTTSSAGSGSGRLRWLVAGVATVLVVVLLVGAFALFGARTATPSLVAQYAPANAAAYLEVRYDLPGDQAANLAAFMSHFPGFADAAAFKQKVDETLSNALQRTGSGLDWKTDIEPWFGGQIGLFTNSVAPAAGTPPSFTAVFSVKDRAKLDEVVNAHVAASGFTQEDYNGQVIWSGTAGDSDKRVSLAVTDEAFVVSTRSEDLKSALDTKAGTATGLADDAFFTSQLSAMHADRLALVYYDYGTLLESMPVPSPGAADLSGLPPDCLNGFTSAANTKLLGEVRAEDDHLSFNVRSTYPSGEGLPPAPSNKSTDLAESMPASTVAYLEMRQVGANVKFLVQQLLKCMDTSQSEGFDPSQLQALIGTAPEDYFDFLVDAGLGVTSASDKFGVGLVATVDDENVARTRVERLLSALRLAGGMGGAGITVEEQQHGDTTITAVTIAGDSVAEPGQPAPPPIKLSVAVSNGRLYLGLDDFVATALDQEPATSLATDARLQSALAEVGNENSGLAYLDIGGLRGYVESAMPADERAHYDAEVKPFIAPLDSFVVVTRNDNGTNAGNGFLYVE